MRRADASLESDVGITISIGTGTLTFGGGLVEITIDAPTVSITAGNIDIGTRRLTITASGGALTLNTDITADMGSMGNVEIFATGGALTIGGDINTRGGALDLSSMGAGAGITLNGPITLEGGAITLTGAVDGNFGLIVRAGGVLTLNSDINTGTTSDLFLRGMTIDLGGDGSTTISLEGRIVTLTGALTTNAPALTITANSVIRLNDNINTGTGNPHFG